MGKINFRKAFTLAEVLVTLGIIGVVAAMTIPGLINSYEEKVALAGRVQFFAPINIE